MLQFARRNTSHIAPVTLTNVIEKALELAGNDYDLKKKYDFRNVKVVREYQRDLPEVPCMETEIEQVVFNLIRNATQAFVPEENQEQLRIVVRTMIDHNYARIEVEDNGPGIEESVRKKIFEPFFTTKPVGEGTGLGLSVSYMIITNNHQGLIDVESEPGRGAKFIIRLPLNSNFAFEENTVC